MNYIPEREEYFLGEKKPNPWAQKRRSRYTIDRGKEELAKFLINLY